MLVDEFYNVINELKLLFICIEVDEFIYLFYVMVCYELEKELFDGIL